MSSFGREAHVHREGHRNYPAAEDRLLPEDTFGISKILSDYRVETIYIPYTQEKRASTRIKDSPDTLASCLRRFLAHTISHELGIGAGNTLQGGSAAFRKPFTDAVGKWLIPDRWVSRKN